jgi:threonylcarbamoyladenosine tRNA methylthiotransferase MtaB
VVVTGCHSQLRAADFSRCDLIIPNEDKHRFVEQTLQELDLADAPHTSGEVAPLYPLLTGNTRAFVKIQDGCDFRCTFCISTVARGASRSRPAEDVLEEVAALVRDGCREVVLTGVNSGSYLHPPDTDLGGLLERILTETEIERVRLSSLEPWNFRTGWAALWERFEDRLCAHLHMSLQSGSAGVLQRMARPYTPGHYRRKLDEVRARIPLVGVTTDLIVGFPGETDAEHEESLQFVQALDLAGGHVFTFSPRPGSEAATLPHQFPKTVKEQRYREMKRCVSAAAESFRQNLLGRTLPVLWETVLSDGTVSGLTGNYVRIHAPPGTTHPNAITPTKLDRIEGDRLWGQPAV